MQLWSDAVLLKNPKVRRWFIAGLVLLPLVMSASGLCADYVGDSWAWFRPETWTDLASHFSVDKAPPGYYRPLGLVTLLLEYKLFGTSPIVPRAIKFATYALTCLLAFLILEALSRSFSIGAVGALIFAVMPSHVPSVFQMAQIITLNAVFFSLLTFWLAGPSYRRKPSWTKLVLSCLAFAAGLLSYQYAVFIPLFLIAYELFWGLEDGWAAVKGRIVRLHLWLWVLSASCVGLNVYQMSRFGGWYPWDVQSLTVPVVIKRIVPVVYGTISPLQLSPALCVAAVLLLLVGLRSAWRFGLFLIIWMIVAPALNYLQELVWFHRVYLASFGAAGLLGYLTVFCLGALLDTKRHSRPTSGLIRVLDWAVAISSIYWVFELFRTSWVEFFFQERIAGHARLCAALIIAIALVLRSAITKSLLPRLSRLPLKAMSAGLIVLILGWYTLGFLELFAMSVVESDDVSRLPEAVLAAQPEVPDNTLILVAIDDGVAFEDEVLIFAYLRARLRSEYGKDPKALGATSFASWVKSFQYNRIPSGTTVLTFAFDGERAIPVPGLAGRILKRQDSYFALSGDVIHARAVTSTAKSNDLRLTPETDSMFIDRADLLIEAAIQPPEVRLDFTSGGAPVTLKLPATMDGTIATVYLAREPKWSLAEDLGQVRISASAGLVDLPVREARLVQTKGLIAEAPLRSLPDGPSPMIVFVPRRALTHVPIFFPINGLARCLAYP